LGGEILVVEEDTSALIVLVPEVESLVGDFRRTFDISGTYGLGAHVTILFPFLSPDSFKLSFGALVLQIGWSILRLLLQMFQIRVRGQLTRHLSPFCARVRSMGD
jgi:hypothetical protein